MIEILLGNTVVAAALALFVFVLCRCFKPCPAVRHALWLIVVVKLLSPVGLIWEAPLPFEKPSFLDISEKSAPIHREAVAASESDLATRLPIEGPVFRWIEQTPLNEESTTEMLATVDVTPVQSEAPISIPPSALGTPDSSPEHIVGTVYLWLLILWLAGAILVFFRYGRRTIRFAAYARFGKPASPSLQRQVAEMAAALGVRAPKVRVLTDLPSPVVWSLFRPVLLWPKGLQDELSSGGRRAVLVHELAHLRRRDHWVRWLELAAAVVHWWNPLFWLARRQMRFHAELACDAWVTGTIPDSRRDYAEALLEVCARFSRAAAPSPAVGVGGDGRRDFQRRLTMIMREQSPYRLASGAKLFVVLMMMAALPAWTLGQTKPEKPKPAPSTEKNVVIGDVDGDGFLDLVTLALDVDIPDNSKHAKEIEAKIAELKKQLDALKVQKTIDLRAVDIGPLKIVIGNDGGKREVRVITIDAATGKVIQEEKKVINRSPNAKPTATKLAEALDLRIKLDELPKQAKYKVIGADGKEIKDAKVIVVGQEAVAQKVGASFPLDMARKHLIEAQKQAEVRAAATTAVEDLGKTLRVWRNAAAPSGATNPISLSRASYKLPKDKVEALAAFLKANVKASVLEMKVDGDTLTITTTPEAQKTIGGLVSLMGQATNFDKEIGQFWKWEQSGKR